MPKTPSENNQDQYEEQEKRRSQQFVKAGGNEGVVFVKPSGQNPLVDAANEVFKKAARRKLQ